MSPNLRAKSVCKGRGKATTNKSTHNAKACPTSSETNAHLAQSVVNYTKAQRIMVPETPEPPHVGTPQSSVGQSFSSGAFGQSGSNLSFINVNVNGGPLQIGNVSTGPKTKVINPYTKNNPCTTRKPAPQTKNPPECSTDSATHAPDSESSKSVTEPSKSYPNKVPQADMFNDKLVPGNVSAKQACLAKQTILSGCSAIVHFDKVQEYSDRFTMHDIKEYVGHLLSLEVSPVTIVQRCEAAVSQYVVSVCKRIYIGDGPTNFYEDLNQSSVKEYFGKIRSYINEEILDRMYGLHDRCFADGSPSLDAIKQLIATECSRSNYTSTNNNQTVSYDRLPLCRKADEYSPQYEKVSEMYTDPLGVHQINIDLVLEAMMRRNDYKSMLALNLNRASVGRANEPTDVTYRKMYWDNSYDCLVASWWQQKTLTQAPTTWTADVRDPELCVFFTMGLHWMMDDGLCRPRMKNNPSRAEREVWHLVFPPGSVTDTILNTSIRKGIDNDELKKFFHNTGVRSGAIQDLANNFLITYDESLARGGWACGTNRAKYVQWLIRMLVPGMLSLAGYDNVRMKVVQPKLSACGPIGEKNLLRVGRQIFRNTMPEFEPDGKLYPLYRTVLATMIMWATHLMEKYGADDKAVRALLRGFYAQDDPIVRGKQQAVYILTDYSKKIRTDFLRRISEEETRSSSGGSDGRILLEQSRKIAELSETLSNQMDVINKLSDMLASVVSALGTKSQVDFTTPSIVGKPQETPPLLPNPATQQHSPKRPAESITPDDSLSRPSKFRKDSLGRTIVNKSALSAPTPSDIADVYELYVHETTTLGDIVKNEHTCTLFSSRKNSYIDPIDGHFLGEYKKVLMRPDGKVCRHNICPKFDNYIKPKEDPNDECGKKADPDKYRKAVYLAFMLCTKDERAKLVNQEIWSTVDKTLAMKDMPGRVKALHCFIKKSAKATGHKDAYQGCANWFSNSRSKGKNSDGDDFSSFLNRYCPWNNRLEDGQPDLDGVPCLYSDISAYVHTMPKIEQNKIKLTHL